MDARVQANPERQPVHRIHVTFKPRFEEPQPALAFARAFLLGDSPIPRTRKIPRSLDIARNMIKVRQDKLMEKFCSYPAYIRQNPEQLPEANQIFVEINYLDQVLHCLDGEESHLFD